MTGSKLFTFQITNSYMYEYVMSLFELVIQNLRNFRNAPNTLWRTWMSSRDRRKVFVLKQLIMMKVSDTLICMCIACHMMFIELFYCQTLDLLINFITIFIKANFPNFMTCIIIYRNEAFITTLNWYDIYIKVALESDFIPNYLGWRPTIWLTFAIIMSKIDTFLHESIFTKES